MSAHRTRGPLLYMVCYKTDSSSHQTYWNIYEADTPEEATALDVQAHNERSRGQMCPSGQPHRCWTVPYNRAGMTPEQTYAAHVADRVMRPMRPSKTSTRESHD